jgi:endonuclease YncB( thermonuclease family)
MDKPNELGQTYKKDDLDRIFDGDTTTTTDGKRQRYTGYDSFETDKDDKITGNPLGDVGRDALEAIFDSGGTAVGTGERDGYKRELTDLHAADGTKLDTELIEAGLAQPINIGSSFEERQSQAQAEMTSVARQALGLRTTQREDLAPFADKAADIRAKREWRPFTDNPNAEMKLETYDKRSTLHTSWDRGIANATTAAGGFLNWMGDAFDKPEWVEKGKSMALKGIFDGDASAREVATYEDIGSVDDAITYLIETTGEMAPQVLMDATSLLAGAGIGGSSAIAFRRAAVDGVVKAAKAGALSATAANGFIQGTGNMEVNLEAEGSEVNTGAAAASGVASAVLNTAPIAAVLPRFGKAAGLSDGVVNQTLKALDRVKDIGKTAAVGAATEGAAGTAQAIIDAVIEAEALDEEWDIDTTQVIDDTLRGILGGGGATAVGSGMSHAFGAMREYDQARKSVDAEGNAQNKDGWMVNEDGSIQTEETVEEVDVVAYDPDVTPDIDRRLDWGIDKGEMAEGKEDEYWSGTESYVKRPDDPDEQPYYAKMAYTNADVPNLKSDEYKRVESVLQPNGEPLTLNEVSQAIDAGQVTQEAVVRYLSDDVAGQANSIYGRYDKELAATLNARALNRLVDRVRDGDAKFSQETIAIINDAIKRGDDKKIRDAVKRASPALASVVNKAAVRYDWKRMWNEFTDRQAPGAKPKPETKATETPMQAERREVDAERRATLTPDETVEKPQTGLPKLGLLDKKASKADGVPNDSENERKSYIEKAKAKANYVVQKYKDERTTARFRNYVRDLDAVENAQSIEALSPLAEEYGVNLPGVRRAKSRVAHESSLLRTKNATDGSKARYRETAKHFKEKSDVFTPKAVSREYINEAKSLIAKAIGDRVNAKHLEGERAKLKAKLSDAERYNRDLKKLIGEDPEVKQAAQLVANDKLDVKIRRRANEFLKQRVADYRDEQNREAGIVERDETIAANPELDEDGNERTMGDVHTVEHGLDHFTELGEERSERERKANREGFTRQVSDLFAQLSQVKGIDPAAIQSTFKSTMNRYVGKGWRELTKHIKDAEDDNGNPLGNAAHPYKIVADGEGINRDKFGQRPIRALKKDSIEKLNNLMKEGRTSDVIDHLSELGVFAPGHVVGEMPKVTRKTRLKQYAREASYLSSKGQLRKVDTVEASNGKKFVMDSLVRDQLAIANRERGDKKGTDELSDIAETSERNATGLSDVTDEFHAIPQLVDAITSAIGEMLENGYDVDLRELNNSTVVYRDPHAKNEAFKRITLGEVRNKYRNQLAWKNANIDADTNRPDSRSISADESMDVFGIFISDFEPQRDKETTRIGTKEDGPNEGKVIRQRVRDPESPIANREDRNDWSSIDELERARSFHGAFAGGEGTDPIGAGRMGLNSPDQIDKKAKTAKKVISDRAEPTPQKPTPPDSTQAEVLVAKAEIKDLRQRQANAHPAVKSLYDDPIADLEKVVSDSQTGSHLAEQRALEKVFAQASDMQTATPTTSKPKVIIRKRKQSEAKSSVSLRVTKKDDNGKPTEYTIDGGEMLRNYADPSPQKRAEASAALEMFLEGFVGPRQQQGHRDGPKDSAAGVKDAESDINKVADKVHTVPNVDKNKETVRAAKRLVRTVRRKRGAARQVLAKVVRSIDTRIRNIHPEIADAVRKFTLDAQGHSTQFVSKMEDIGNNRRIQKGWDDAVNGRKTKESAAYMKWLNDVDDEIASIDPNHKRHAAPRLSLDMEKVDKHRAGFADILKKAGVADPHAYIERLFDGNGIVEFATTIDPVSDAKATSAVLAKVAKELKEGGFLDTDAPRALTHYANAAARHMAWQRNMAKDGKLSKLVDEVHPSNKDELIKLMDGVTGKNAIGTPRFLRIANSVTLGFHTATILWFSAVASIPELAGVVARNKGQLDGLHNEFRKSLMGLSRDEIRKFAKDYGVIGGEVTQHALQQLFAMDEMTVGRTAQRIQNRVFAMNGQHWLTQTNRMLAASAARNFLSTHAESGTERSKRLLAELDIDATTVKKHLKDGNMKSEAGRAYTRALHRFVNQAVTNPRADQLPLIATDPRYAMVTSLKKFFYGFYGNVNKGLTAEYRAGRVEGDVSPAVMAMVMTAAAVIPLAIMAEVLREFIKYPLGRPDRGQEKSASEYMMQVVGATGMLGPLHMAQLPVEMSSYGKSAWAVAAGPTASYLHDMVTGKGTVSRHVPIAAQQPYLRKLVDDTADKLLE